MTSAEEILSKMEKALDDLLANARQIVEVSLRPFSQSDLQSLQQRQQELSQQLQELDTRLNQEYPNAASESNFAAVQHMEEGLQEFQKLNNVFMDNMRKQHTIIQFEQEKAHSSHPDGSLPAVNSESDH